MIERKFVAEKVKEFRIKEFINSILKKSGQSDVKLKKTPLGEKIIIRASKPGLIVGRKGENIKLLTSEIKKHFDLENPQIEIEEIEEPSKDATIIGERVATTLERFGSGRFKHIGHRVLEDVMRAGALGAEVTISGKIPGSRAKRWRFYQGYLKKSGFISQSKVLKSYTTANLKTGTVGIQVKILPGDVVLPDSVILLSELQKETEEKNVEETKPEQKPVKKETKRKTVEKKEEKGKEKQPEAPKEKEEKKKVKEAKE
jgi:small subunit ribosomal protein S3